MAFEILQDEEPGKIKLQVPSCCELLDAMAVDSSPVLKTQPSCTSRDHHSRPIAN